MNSLNAVIRSILISLWFLLPVHQILAQNILLSDGMQSEGSLTLWTIGLIEIPLLIMATIFCFRVAKLLKGSMFDKSIKLITWGFGLIALLHLHTQFENLFGLKLLSSMLGETSIYFQYLFLLCSWTFAFIGFFKLHQQLKNVLITNKENVGKPYDE